MKIFWVKIIVLAKGIFLILLGLVHNVNAFNAKTDSISKQMPANYSQEFILWYVVGGTAFIFTGILDIFAFFGFKRGESWAWYIVLCSAFFVIFIGLEGIVIKNHRNGYILLGMGLIELCPFIIHKLRFSLVKNG